jgi:hypothetical protein
MCGSAGGAQDSELLRVVAFELDPVVTNLAPGTATTTFTDQPLQVRLHEPSSSDAGSASKFS